MMLSERLGLPDEINRLFLYLTERWDGNGVLGRKAGDEIPMALRIVTVARDAAYQTLIGGREHAARVIRERAGHAFDPDVAMMLSDNASEMLSTADDTPTVWDSVLDAEPGPHLTWTRKASTALSAPLATSPTWSPHRLVGHSAGVAQLAGDTATELGLAPDRSHKCPQGRPDT